MTILASKTLQPSWDFPCRCYSQDDIWHATAKGMAIAQLGACSQKCNPCLDLKWMRIKCAGSHVSSSEDEELRNPPSSAFQTSQLEISVPGRRLYGRLSSTLPFTTIGCSGAYWRCSQFLNRCQQIMDARRGGLFPASSSASNNVCN